MHIRYACMLPTTVFVMVWRIIIRSFPRVVLPPLSCVMPVLRVSREHSLCAVALRCFPLVLYCMTNATARRSEVPERKAEGAGRGEGGGEGGGAGGGDRRSVG